MHLERNNNTFMDELDIYSSLETLMNIYSLLRKNLLQMNLKSIEKYLNDDFRIAYRNRNFAIKFGDGSFNNKEKKGFLNLLKEWKKEKIKILLTGGVAYRLLGGKEETHDLDYLIMVSEENEEAAKSCNLLRNDQAAHVHIFPELFFLDGTPFLCEKEEQVYPFELRGIDSIRNSDLKKNSNKILENRHTIIYYFNVPSYIKYQENVLDYYEQRPELMNISDIVKWKRRNNELLSLMI